MESTDCLDDCKRTHKSTYALQHLAFSERMASVGKELSVVLPVIPGGKLWKTGVGGAPEPVDRRKVLFVGHTRHSGYVVMPPVTNWVQIRSQIPIVDLHHRQPIVVYAVLKPLDVWVVFIIGCFKSGIIPAGFWENQIPSTLCRESCQSSMARN